jgi:hypothetical protein
LTLVLNPNYYEGIVFQAVTEADSNVIAAGGRYDRLLQEYSTKPPAIIISGATFAVERLTGLIHAHEQRTAARIKISDTEVLVCSSGRNMLEDRIQIAVQLWDVEIKAEYLHSEKQSFEELYVHCKNLGIPWMVMLNDRKYRTLGLLRVKNVDKNTEVEIHKRELTEYMSRALTKFASIETNSASVSTMAGDAPPSSLPKLASVMRSHVQLDVTILNTEHKSKAKKNIAKSAENKLAPIASSIASSTSVKVAAVDLPHNILKELVVGFNIATDSFPALDRYPRFREQILELLGFLAKWKHMPFLFLYSYRDDKYEIMHFH